MKQANNKIDPIKK